MESARISSVVYTSIPFTSAFAIGIFLVGIVYFIVKATPRPYPGIPEVTLGEDGSRPDPRSWIANAKEMVDKGLANYPSCFQVLSSTGYKIIVPSRFADELRSHPDVNLNGTFAKDFFVQYPGFDGMKQHLQDDRFTQEVIRAKLTQSLGLVTGDLVEETTEAVHDTFGDGKGWQTSLIKQDLQNVVARVSTRVFLGKEMCRNKDWQRITKDYTVDMFASARILRGTSALLRPIAFLFNPTCRKLRRDVKEVRRLIWPEVEKRFQETKKVLQEGGKPAKVGDAIGWMVEMSKGKPRDYAAAQLSLSFVAIHTTSDAVITCMLKLCDLPELTSLLREELITVLKNEGWAKTSLYKLRIMDSFIRETQRTNGMSVVGMSRLVVRQITLSDGTVLPAGSRILVSDERRFSETCYPDPSKFDVARFLRMRQKEGEENRHQTVTLSPDLMPFGYGQYACPGRFFAINEIKIILAFLLLKYDVRSVPGQALDRYTPHETSQLVTPTIKVQLRKRTEEIDLISPQTA